MKQIFLFAVAGTFGFLVDSSVLVYFVDVLGQNIFISRCFSFLSAVFVTWMINRSITFDRKNSGYNASKEYFYYTFIQTIGALLNFVIFFILIYLFEEMKNNLVIPLAIAAFFTLVFNFVFIKKKVYTNG